MEPNHQSVGFEHQWGASQNGGYSATGHIWIPRDILKYLSEKQISIFTSATWD